MRIFRHYHRLDSSARKVIVAVGNFDGVHQGHVQVIRAAAAVAHSEGTLCGVLTFEPHPREFFQPDIRPFRLTPFRAKARRLEALGVDVMFNLRFSPTLARTQAEDFISQVLLRGMDVGGVVVGPNFRFGAGRRGDNAMLARCAEVHGFRLIEVPIQGDGGEAFSSSRIRTLITEGDVARAGRILGRWWEIEGHVRPGQGIGRGLGFPTANLSLARILHPPSGIYAVRAGISDADGTRWHHAAAYVGARPTFGGHVLGLEVHLLDRDEDLYGKRLRVAFVKWLREDKTFAAPEALRRQMAADCERARHVLADPEIADLMAKPNAA